MTGRGIFVAALGIILAVAGRLVGDEELVLVAIAAAILIACGYFVCLGRISSVRKNLDIQVSLPSSEVPKDSRAMMLVRLVAKAPTPPMVLVSLANELAFYEKKGRRPTPRFAIPPMRAGEEAQLTLPLPTGARGVFHLPSVAMAAEDAFGLFWSQAAFGPDIRLLVYPEIDESYRLDAPDRSGSGGFFASAGSSGRPLGSAGSDFSEIRPYRAGDRLARLHWPSVSRGDLLVRDFGEEAEGEVTVVLDTASPAVDPAELEARISEAASRGVAAIAKGWAVELVTPQGGRLAVSPDGQGRRRLLRALAAYQ